jgi:hypothetical protein
VGWIVLGAKAGAASRVVRGPFVFDELDLDGSFLGGGAHAEL